MSEALKHARDRLLLDLQPSGCWAGKLSSSALATAVASFALKAAGKTDLAARGLRWLSDHRNADGGWGDSPESPSNFTATLLAGCALNETVGSPREITQTILDFYGDDRTFSVPILTMCLLGGALDDDWRRVPQLPFELATLPRQLFSAMRLPVVSYAIPALIAIGLVRHRNLPVRGSWIRERCVGKALRLLENIQPSSGGFLEAAPLTGFVVMSLIGAGYAEHPVVQSGVRFLEETMRDDGSWPIDVNLSTWVTSLATRALADDLSTAQRDAIRAHLLRNQWQVEHPLSGSDAGGWGWTPTDGGVPDADDTAAALLALHELGCEVSVATAGIQWLLNLQNRDGGMPTFCKGWGRLPFDRSCSDLTAHALRAFTVWHSKMDPAMQRRMKRATVRGLRFLKRQQRSDGSWLPLWFGHQAHPQGENPIYGTVRVVEALLELDATEFPLVSDLRARGLAWLETVSVGEDLEGLALVAGVTGRGLDELEQRTAGGREFLASPIGLYFASLWYSETLYPVIFTLEALKRARRES